MFKIQPKMCTKRYIFNDFSILTEKQHIKPLDLTSHESLASFDILIDPVIAKVKKKFYGGHLTQCNILIWNFKVLVIDFRSRKEYVPNFFTFMSTHKRKSRERKFSCTTAAFAESLLTCAANLTHQSRIRLNQNLSSYFHKSVLALLFSLFCKKDLLNKISKY